MKKTEKECALINMSFCKNYLRKQSLDYINRIEAENERLQELLKGWKTEAYKVADEKDKLYCEAVERVKTTKSEAIKEFVERLKGFSRRMYPLFDEPIIDCKDIDNLVKEMVGDAE